MKRPPKQLRIKYNTDFNDLSCFAANARLLQSIWREENSIRLERQYGNFLSSEQAYEHGLNFLTPKIFDIVNKEVEANRLRKRPLKKLIKTDRLYENLLASQPLAFNLFGELIEPDYGLANKVLRKLFPDRVRTIYNIDFEVSPGRGNIQFIGDDSAFDVFIEYEGNSGKGFIGIEIKYAEALKDVPASFKPRYKDISERSGKFRNNSLEHLCCMPESIE